MDPGNVNAYCTPSHRSPSSSNLVVGHGHIAGAVQAVVVKVPTFWPTHPEVWFSFLESQFATKNITADDTKYYHAVQGLDKTTAEEMSAFLLNPPAISKFYALKTLVISTFDLTQADNDASGQASILTGCADTALQKNIKRTE